MANIVINKIDAPTWSWMKINKENLELNTTSSKLLDTVLPTGISLVSGSIPEVNNRKVLSGCGEEFTNFINANSTEQTLVVEGEVSSPVVFNMLYDNKEASATLLKVLCKENSKATLIFVYSSPASSEGLSAIDTRVFVNDNAEINIIKANLLSSSYVQADNTSYVVGNNCKVGFTQIELGGKETYSGLHVSLDGSMSAFQSNLAYLTRNTQKLDMNHVVLHYGKKTTSNMIVKGSMDDESIKNYRGNIDFKCGCSGSCGSENEDTLMLSDKVINRSIPVILCDEDDIEGNHGASIGRLGEDVLYYLQTRGISKEAAEQIIARAKIESVVSLIDNQETVDTIHQYMNGVFSHE